MYSLCSALIATLSDINIIELSISPRNKDFLLRLIWLKQNLTDNLNSDHNQHKNVFSLPCLFFSLPFGQSLIMFGSHAFLSLEDADRLGCQIGARTCVPPRNVFEKQKVLGQGVFPI